MDAKNLDVLRQLQEAITAEQEKPSARPHISSRGFSEEAEKVFRDIAKSRISNPEASESGPAHARRAEEPVIDRATRELRHELAAINRKIDRQEEKQRRQLEEDSRRLTKAERRRARQAEKAKKVAAAAKINPSSKVKARPLDKIKAASSAKAPSLSKWIEKTCWRCHSKMVVHSDWTDPPGLCKSCMKFLNETHIPSRGKDRSTTFTYVRIVNGGAPGLGKRH